MHSAKGHSANCTTTLGILYSLSLSLSSQVLPVPYSIRARVATSDLVFSSSDIDFGTCTLHESVVATLSITNTSILPQEFGFVHLPDVSTLTHMNT